MDLAQDGALPLPDGPVHVQSGSLVGVVDGLSLGLVDELELGTDLAVQLVPSVAQRLDRRLGRYSILLLRGELLGPPRVHQPVYAARRPDPVRLGRRAPVGGLDVVPDHSGQVVAVEDGGAGVIYGQVAHRLVGAWVVLRPLVSASAPSTLTGSRAFTVDGIPRRTAETVRRQNLSESCLRAQALHPLVVLAVGQGRVGGRFDAAAGSNWSAKEGDMAQLALERYRLALQPRPDAQREDSLGRHGGAVREPFERVVVASQRDEVGEDAEEGVVVEAERVGLPARSSASKALSVLGVTHGRFRFLADFVFRSWTCSMGIEASVLPSRCTKSLMSPYVNPRRAAGRDVV